MVCGNDRALLQVELYRAIQGLYLFVQCAVEIMGANDCHLCLL